MMNQLSRSGKVRSPQGDLDYYFIRASMVIVFLFFWLSEMVRLRSAGVDPLRQQRYP